MQRAKQPKPQQSGPTKQAKPRARVVVTGARLLRGERREGLRAVRKVLRAALLPVDVEVGVAFVHDLEMRALNRAWRGKDKPTDVLSFAAHDGEVMAGAEQVLGDIVISVDTARRQARALGHPLALELAVLVAHGLCHLAGLDHERSDDEARSQAACEHTLLALARLDVTASLTSRC